MDNSSNTSAVQLDTLDDDAPMGFPSFSETGLSIPNITEVKAAESPDVSHELEVTVVDADQTKRGETSAILHADELGYTEAITSTPADEVKLETLDDLEVDTSKMSRQQRRAFERRRSKEIRSGVKRADVAIRREPIFDELRGLHRKCAEILAINELIALNLEDQAVVTNLTTDESVDSARIVEELQAKLPEAVEALQTIYQMHGHLTGHASANKHVAFEQAKLIMDTTLKYHEWMGNYQQFIEERAKTILGYIKAARSRVVVKPTEVTPVKEESVQ